ncbi:prolipoprotein diacylglyceryl transferase [Mycoplasma sp. P36-A1]|uniref:prolipoprotein diacylglyceryl transferase n=1 Tax=Mycoplasma sp. P36-A1 TaxID=3252900 RepID=UPI003C2C83DC
MFTSKEVILGPINISYYAICILVGAFLAFYLSRREWKLKGYNTSELQDFFINVLLIGVIGARLWYVLFSLPYYISNPSEIIAVWNGGLAIQGGVIAGIAYGYYYFTKRGYDFWDAADSTLPYMLIAQAFGRWGNFFNQEAFGQQVSYQHLKDMFIPEFIINKMFIDGAYRQPTFLYESIFCIVIFLIIMLIVKKVPLKIGQSALLYLIFYSFGRIIIEGMRSDSLMFFGIKTAQLLSLLVIIVGVYLFYRFDKTHKQNKLQKLRMIENGK